ncbi:MAG TPA: BON domain-containing protein [Actinoplanes sp.]|nr:BON domain-containing protein [Actinoplanes sp.]
MAGESETVDVEVQRGVVTLTGRVDRWSTRDVLDSLIRQIPGVVDVANKLTFEFDDRAHDRPRSSAERSTRP